MPSTYSDLLRIELIADGEQTGLWGQTTNSNLGVLIEDAISGYLSLELPDADYVLQTALGLSDEARYAALEFTGVLTATRTVTIPSTAKLYVVKNATNFDLVISAGGATKTLPAGRAATVVTNGTDVRDQIDHLTKLYTPEINGPLNLNGTNTITGETLNTSTSGFQVPQGTEAQRPVGANGKIRFNEDIGQYEGYSNGAWASIGGGATGGGADQVFVLNDQTVTESYTIPANKNAHSAGPIVIAEGATVTVSDGARWVIS